MVRDEMSASVTEIPSTESAAETPSPRAVAPVDFQSLEEHELVIQPRRGWAPVNWAELLRGRELLFFLIWRDIKVRYKQAVLGVGWAVLQPIVNMLVFTIIFGLAAGMKTRVTGVPYSVFVLCGLLPWQLFSSALNLGGMSLVNQQHLLTKIYFPRLFVPTAVVGGAVVDMAVASIVFVVLLLFHGIAPTLGVLLLPLLVALTVVLALGVAYLLSALTISYRDFRFIIPFMSQIWMWMSFVAFPASLADHFGKWKPLLALNPMYAIIAGYRKLILGWRLPDSEIGWDPRYFAASVLMTVLLFVTGLFYFRRAERRFADIA